MAVTTFQTPGYRLVYCHAWPVAPLLDGVSITAWMDGPHQLLKRTPKLDARLLHVDGRQVFVKRYLGAGLLKRVMARLGLSRARRIFRISQSMIGVGVSVPEPYAWLSEHGCGHSIYVCEALNARDMKSVASDELGLAALGGVNKVFDNVAEMLCRLHRAGFVHGDMKWPNIMVETNGDHLVLVDLDGIRRPWLSKKKRFARDLARFVIDARELGVDEKSVQYFMRAYARRVDIAEKALWDNMAPSYRKLAERHRRRYGSQL